MLQTKQPSLLREIEMLNHFLASNKVGFILERDDELGIQLIIESGDALLKVISLKDSDLKKLATCLINFIQEGKK